MDKSFSSIDKNIQIINESLSISSDIDEAKVSKDFFKLIELITDFFLNFQITEPQNAKLFALFLPVQVRCFASFYSQGIFRQYDFSNFWSLFSNEFLKTTNTLMRFNFTKYATQINETIIPFLESQAINDTIFEFISKTIPQFNSILEELSANDVSLNLISKALIELKKLKNKYYEIIDFLNQIGEKIIIIPQSHVNLLLEIKYSLNYYDKLIKVRSIIIQLPKSLIYFAICPLKNVDEIRIFSEKCVQFLILEIKSLVKYADESQIPTFFQVSTLLGELIASSHLFMNQHIIEIWTKILPSLNSLSIKLNEEYEVSQYTKLFETQNYDMSYNFTLDKIRSLIQPEIPTDFPNSYQLFKNLFRLSEKCTDPSVSPYIENLIFYSTARLIYSKLVFDQQNLNKILLLLDKEPSDICAISYLKSCVQQLVNLGLFPSPRNSCQARITLALIDSIVKTNGVEWIKFLPTSEMLISLISYNREATNEMRKFLFEAEEATIFADHLFIDEIDEGSLCKIIKFAENQIQLSGEIRPHLFNFSVIYEIFPLINEIHRKYGKTDKKIRSDFENIYKSESTYVQLQKLVNNGLFNKEEEKIIAKESIHFLIFLLYEPEEADNFLSSFYAKFGSHLFVPHCTALLSDCYNALECFDYWRLSSPDELDDVFTSLLKFFNTFLNGSSQVDQMKLLEASFREKITKTQKSREEEFKIYFTNIEKFTVIGPMLCTITKIVSANDKMFPLSQNDMIRIVAQVNNARLILSCLKKVVNVEGALIDVDVSNELIERIEQNTASNLMIDFAQSELGEIIDHFTKLDIVNPKFLFEYFQAVGHFLFQQVQTSSVLYFSNASKIIKDVAALLAKYSETNDHFKLREAIFYLNGLLASLPSSSENPPSEIILFQSTLNAFLEKANVLLCLLQMKIYINPIISSQSENENEQVKLQTTENDSESIFDPVLQKLSILAQDQEANQGEVHQSVIKMKSKINSIKSNNFDKRINMIKSTNIEEFHNSKLEQLNAIHEKLTKKLLSFQSADFDSDSSKSDRLDVKESQHARSEQNLRKLEREFGQIESRNDEKRKELETLTKECDELLKERDQQLQSIESEASEEHNRMSIMKLIINNELDLTSFDQRPVDPQIAFLHEQLKDATSSNTKLMRELRNRQFRIDKPPLPNNAMVDILKESPQHRNWLSNDATNTMSLRGSLKLLQKQREDLFKDLINARISFTQKKIEALSSKASSSFFQRGADVEVGSPDPKKQSEAVNQYMIELQKIADSAETRKDFDAIQDEFAFVADKLFFTLQEEIKEIKREINLKKKYGDDLNEVEKKNFQDLLKIGLLQNSVH